MDVWAIVVPLVVAALLGLGALLIAPVRDRINLWTRRHASPSGVVVHVERMVHTTAFYYPANGPGKPASYPGPHVKPWPMWAYEAGGIEVGTSILEVTLQALDEAAIAVDSPILHWRSQALPEGEAIAPDAVGNGAALTARHYTFTIEGDEVRQEYFHPEFPEERTPSFTLKKNETARMLVFVDVKEGLAKWTLELPMLVNGRKSTERISNNGSGFETVGRAGLRFTYWVDGRWLRPKCQSGE